MLDRDLPPVFKCDPQRESLPSGRYFCVFPPHLRLPVCSQSSSVSGPKSPSPSRRQRSESFRVLTQTHARPGRGGATSRWGAEPGARPSRAGGVCLPRPAE